jgi:hypothetical protein
LLAGLYSSRHGRARTLLTSGLRRSPRAGAWNSVAVGLCQAAVRYNVLACRSRQRRRHLLPRPTLLLSRSIVQAHPCQGPGPMVGIRGPG